ncbi:MAG: murein biosynthesis integral membrane protein MurJ [Pseudomonadota bacterium]
MSAPRGAVRLVAAFATVGGWTMASRILGFARDVAIAAVLGAGAVAEAFFVAFTLPNLFRRFFAEGAFNTAFVPMFAKRVEAAGSGEAPETAPDTARRFAEEALACLASVLVVFTIVAQLAMPWLVWGLASGLDGERYDLAVAMGRIVFPYILLISVAALISGCLNALDRFWAAAAAPVLLNVVLISALLAAETGVLSDFVGLDAGPREDGGTHVGAMLSWGVLIAGIAQAGFVWRALAIAGLPLRLRMPRFTPEMRRLAIIAAPAALAGGVAQVNLVIGRQVASYFEGAVGWLWYADRVYQLPLGVIGVAIGVVLLPALARHVRRGDGPAGHAALNRAAEFALTLTLPATAALLVMPGLVVAVLFERGAFGTGDTEATALALAIYALGLPAFVLQKVLQPAFFAREDTATPLRYAAWSMLANLLVAAFGAALIGWLAAALGATLAAWLNLALLWRGARRADRGLDIDSRLARRLPRVLAATGIMAAVVLAGAAAADGLDPILRAVALAGIVALGLSAYAAAGLALGAFATADLRGALRRG